MHQQTFNRIVFIVALSALATAAILLSTAHGNADEVTCPATSPCKVVTVTPQEEAAMLAPNGILDMATWAARPLGEYAAQWRDKLKAAPPGKTFEPAAPNSKP